MQFTKSINFFLLLTVVCVTLLLFSCTSEKSVSNQYNTAELILSNAQVYTLNWNEPGLDGTAASNAPLTDDGWQADAQAIAIKEGEILFVGSNEDAFKYKSSESRVIDLNGATVIPGLVDSHTHFIELGAKLSQVNLTDVATEAEAVALVAEKAKGMPKGEWIFGAGWDEGAWANSYPDKTLLTQAVPNHPVVLFSLHGFAIWTNQAALDKGLITSTTAVPVGGDMLLGPDGDPTGLFLNNATNIVKDIIPELTIENIMVLILTMTVC